MKGLFFFWVFVLTSEKIYCKIISVKNYYETLKIRSKATLAEIKSAYYTLARKYHPDVAGERYRAEFEEINEAYNFLCDNVKRFALDMELSGSSANPDSIQPEKPISEKTLESKPENEKSEKQCDGYADELARQISEYEEVLTRFANSGYISRSRELAPDSIKALIRNNRIKRDKAKKL